MSLRKLQRLASGAINVLHSVPSLLRAERHYRPLLATVDRAAIAAVIARFAQDPGFADGRKYLRLGAYLRDSLARAIDLGLDRSPPKQVLDLGSGAGYFLLACRHLGHGGVGFDLPDNAFYRAMFATLGLERVEAAILPLTPLPDLGRRFDLVTAYAITFSKEGRIPGASEWTGTEWHFFLRDLRRFLNPGGRVLLRMNIPELAGLHDAGKYAFFHAPPAGFRVRVLDRREVLFTLDDAA